MKTIIKISILFLLFSSMGAGCVKDHESDQQNVNIMLYDKPLSVIQQYITGNWDLHYQIGGIAGGKYVDDYNSYLNLTSNHIIMGNDLYGVVVDTAIIWKHNDYTYLLSYPSSPISYIVVQIKKDTLVIRDDLNDGYSYYYTKH